MRGVSCFPTFKVLHLHSVPRNLSEDTLSLPCKYIGTGNDSMSPSNESKYPRASSANTKCHIGLPTSPRDPDYPQFGDKVSCDPQGFLQNVAANLEID